MQSYDLVMIFVLVAATLWGARKGLAWQVASILSLGVSYLAALKFSDAIAPFINAEPPWNRFGAMLVIFLSVSLAVWLVFRMVSTVIDRIRLREFDRQIGAIFGLAKGVLLCCVITFFAITLLDGAREPILKSRSGYYIALLIDRADAVMPNEIHDVLGPYLHKLEDELDPALPPGTPRKQHPHDHGEPNKTPRTADAQPWDGFRSGSTFRAAPAPASAQSNLTADPDPLLTLARMVQEKGGRPASQLETSRRNLDIMRAEWNKFFQHDQPPQKQPNRRPGGVL
jgi:membrane protein required for colicin V production